MIGPCESTISGLDALTGQYVNITNNLANASTAGYKRRQSTFGYELSQVAGAGQQRAVGSSRLLLQSSIDWTQGRLRHTGRPLDCALTGQGFFVIETPDGPLYTRNGVFIANDKRQLTDLLGRTVAGKAGPITIPSDVSATDIHIADDGSLSAAGRSIGRLRIVKFDKPNDLETVGMNIFRAPDRLTVENADDVTVSQGFQEGSNVNMVNELVSLISVARMYESNFKSISKYDERLGELMKVVSQ